MLVFFKISIISFVFCEILIQEDNVFNFYLPLLKRIMNFDELDDSTRTRIKQKIIKILGGCSKCMAGQIALWYCIIFKMNSFFCIFDCIFFISATILINYFLEKINDEFFRS